MEDLVILDGIRTPFLRAGTPGHHASAQELARQVLVALLKKTSVPPGEVDEVVLGCVEQPVDAPNLARVTAIQAGFPLQVTAQTVQRNCSSSMQSVTTAWDMIRSGRAEVVVAGGAESLSNSPLLFNDAFTGLFNRWVHAKTPSAKWKVFSCFRPKMLVPRVALAEGLTDPICGLNMGQTAELLSREVGISRREQDEFALESHRRAGLAAQSGRLAREISPIFPPPDFEPITADNGIRPQGTLEALAKLPPLFDKHHGTVTAGNSSQITDGAVALLITTRSRAQAWGVKPLVKITGFAYAGLDPRHMGLGPVTSTAKLLERLGRPLSGMSLIEINEAFAAQVLSCLRLFESDALASKFLGLSRAPGAINRDILNVNGGAIALGHPVGSSGGRLLLTLALELSERNLETGLATLCVGGGQGASFVLERTSYTR